jgi:hypothetical protein
VTVGPPSLQGLQAETVKGLASRATATNAERSIAGRVNSVVFPRGPGRSFHVLAAHDFVDVEPRRTMHAHITSSNSKVASVGSAASNVARLRHQRLVAFETSHALGRSPTNDNAPIGLQQRPAA